MIRSVVDLDRLVDRIYVSWLISFCNLIWGERKLTRREVCELPLGPYVTTSP
jgi:hypothetical protein